MFIFKINIRLLHDQNHIATLNEVFIKGNQSGISIQLMAKLSFDAQTEIEELRSTKNVLEEQSPINLVRRICESHVGVRY